MGFSHLDFVRLELGKRANVGFDMRITALHLYPVKGLIGVSVDAVRVDDYGLKGDRRFLVVQKVSGKFITQRTVPAMTQVRAEYCHDDLVLHSRNLGSISVKRSDSSDYVPEQRRTVTVWSDTVEADDCGDEVAEYLSTALSTDCRLVQIGTSYSRLREVSARSAVQHSVSFADGFPLLVVSEASLDELNRRLIATGTPSVPMNRFRPNLVVSGCPAFDEDTWKLIRAGEVSFRSGGPCERCIVTTTDQETGKRSREPLATLAAFRRDPNQPSAVWFGVNLINLEKSGTVRVGDTLERI